MLAPAAFDPAFHVQAVSSEILVGADPVAASLILDLAVFLAGLAGTYGES